MSALYLMQDSLNNLELVATVDNEKESRGQLQLIYLSASARRWKAAKILGVLWVSALFAVLIPVLHFLLVPLLFICGPIAAYFSYRSKFKLGPTSLSCPNCHCPISILTTSLDWPIRQCCATCNKFIKIGLA